MTTFILCLVTVLCLFSGGTVFADNGRECSEACFGYHQVGYRCTQTNHCLQKDSDDEIHACYNRCMANYDECFELCDSHYEDIKETCTALCSDASILAFSCEDKCFQKEFRKVSSHLPNVTLPEVGIFQGVPYLGEDHSTEDSDASAHLSPRADTDWSWEDDDNEIGDGKKKRDTDWSWEDDDNKIGDGKKKRDADWSWEDDDNEIGDWKKKRDTDWSWEDDGNDIFGDGKKKRDTDWSWEDDGNDIFGDGKKKRDMD